jgi:hypothetical protein
MELAHLLTRSGFTHPKSLQKSPLVLSDFWSVFFLFSSEGSKSSAFGFQHYNTINFLHIHPAVFDGKIKIRITIAGEILTETEVRIRLCRVFLKINAICQTLTLNTSSSKNIRTFSPVAQQPK